MPNPTKQIARLAKRVSRLERAVATMLARPKDRELDDAIDRLHEASRRMRLQCEGEYERTARMFNPSGGWE